MNWQAGGGGLGTLLGGGLGLLATGGNPAGGALGASLGGATGGGIGAQFTPQGMPPVPQSQMPKPVLGAPQNTVAGQLQQATQPPGSKGFLPHPFLR